MNLRYAAAIKKQVKTPVAAVGGFTDPAHMEEVIASGQADLIALGRQSLADPYLPNKARAGREDEITKCMRCSTCFGSAGAYRTFYCAVNPEIGHENDARYLPPVREKKSVLVVGGGVAGMQAALTAAERGHRVTLCEKEKSSAACSCARKGLLLRISSEPIWSTRRTCSPRRLWMSGSIRW